MACKIEHLSLLSYAWHVYKRRKGRGICRPFSQATCVGQGPGRAPSGPQTVPPTPPRRSASGGTEELGLTVRKRQKLSGAGLALFQIRPPEGLSNESTHLRPCNGENSSRVREEQAVEMPGHCCILRGGSLPSRRNSKHDFFARKPVTVSQPGLRTARPASALRHGRALLRTFARNCTQRYAGISRRGSMRCCGSLHISLSHRPCQQSFCNPDTAEIFSSSAPCLLVSGTTFTHGH